MFVRSLRSIATLPPKNETDAPHQPFTSMTAPANASGASYGRLCPTPPVIVRCAYLPANFLAC